MILEVEYLELICKEEELDTEKLMTMLEEEKARQKETKEKITQELAKWVQYQTSDETEIIKDISKIYSMNLSDARDMLGSLPEEPIVDGKNIPDLIKEMRMIRRKLKGNARDKMSKTIDTMIGAYTEHINKSIDSVYWIKPYKKAVKLLIPDLSIIRKFHYIKDGETRKKVIGKLSEMWESNINKNNLDYGAEYFNCCKSFKENKKEIKRILKDISHQSIRKSRQSVLDKLIKNLVCNNPGLTSNAVHSLLPKSYHRSTTPQTISKMLKRIEATNVNGEYFIIGDEIKKDLYSYVAGFIDSDGYITMDSNFSPRVGMIATGNRGRAFFKELERELKCGRLHLDQKVGENNRSQHRLNFYSQDDITKILDKCIPHLRMKKAQGELIREAIRIKKKFKKEEWAKPRVKEIFKLIKWENWKDSRYQGAKEFEKYDINEDDINKYKGNNKMNLMDEIDSIVKEE
tara:strand:- start:282 stop:1661 length:1380 start_codon:yes stop_codon:yes gene_type:complete